MKVTIKDEAVKAAKPVVHPIPPYFKSTIPNEHGPFKDKATGEILHTMVRAKFKKEVRLHDHTIAQAEVEYTVPVSLAHSLAHLVMPE